MFDKRMQRKKVFNTVTFNMRRLSTVNDLLEASLIPEGWSSSRATILRIVMVMTNLRYKHRLYMKKLKKLRNAVENIP